MSCLLWTFTFHNMLQAVYLMSGFIIAAFIALINPEEGERETREIEKEGHSKL